MKKAYHLLIILVLISSTHLFSDFFRPISKKKILVGSTGGIALFLLIIHRLKSAPLPTTQFNMMKEIQQHGTKLPKELRDIIHSNYLAHYIAKKMKTTQIIPLRWYNFTYNWNERFYNAFSRRNLNIVRQSNRYDQCTPEELINPEPESNCFFDIQFWRRGVDYRIDEDTTHTDNFLSIKGIFRMADGINEKNLAVIVTSTDTHLSLLTLVKLKKEYTGDTAPKNIFSATHADACASIALTDDSLICSFNKKTEITDQSYVEIFTVNDTPRMDLQCAITIPSMAKKIVPLGKHTYLGLHSIGTLFILFHTDDNTIEYYPQKHCSTFVDIAVDSSYKTEKGYMPRIAALNDQKEVFVTDVRYFNRPTLFYVHTIPNHCTYTNNEFPLFYDEGKVATLCKDTPYYRRKKLFIWADTTSLLNEIIL